MVLLKLILGIISEPVDKPLKHARTVSVCYLMLRQDALMLRVFLSSISSENSKMFGSDGNSQLPYLVPIPLDRPV